MDRIGDWLLSRRRPRGRELWALKDIDLEVGRGTTMGIVGVNGAGKTTLLKILTGTTTPTTGGFELAGRVAALLELGMGFHADFTGRENILFNGKLSGLTDEELRRRTPSIIAFAELEDFIDLPLRTYSSGMAMRLAFAVASSIEPDVLIVDEALSVGDVHFQQKCLARLRRFRERGVTVLFVSHDPALVKSFCEEAILLDAGRLLERGRPDHVLDLYNALLAEKYRDQGPGVQILRPRLPTENAATTAETAPRGSIGEAPRLGHRTGNFRAVLTRVELRSLGVGGNPALLLPGMEAEIVVRAVALAPTGPPTVGIQIKDRLGNEVYGVNTHLKELALAPLKPGEALTVRFRATMNLGDGVYSVTAAIHEGPTHTETCYDWVERAATFQVLPSPTDRFTGVCRLETELEAHREGASEPEMTLAKAALST